MPAQGDERAPLLGYRDAEAQSGEGHKHWNSVGLPVFSFYMLVGATCSCFFLWGLDVSVVSTLVAPVSSYFHASNQASWIINAFILSQTCIAPSYGRLSNIFGRRQVMLFALSCFILGTIGCAMAGSMGALIAARAVAGVGGGGVFVIGGTILNDIVPLERRGQFQAYNILAQAIGLSGGPPVGGLISQYFGWRAVFWCKVPIMVIVWFCVFRYVRYDLNSIIGPSPAGETKMDKLKRVDFLGLLTIAMSVLAVLVATTMVTQSLDSRYTWSDPIIVALLVFSGITLCAFVLIELRVAREPMIPLRLFKRRMIVSILVALAAYSVWLSAFTYAIPIYLIAVRQLTTGETGARLLGPPVLTVAFGFAVGAYLKSVGRFKNIMLFSVLLIGVTGVLCLWWTSEISGHWFWWSHCFAYIGVGGVVACLPTALLAELGKKEAAIAQSIFGLVNGVSFLSGVQGIWTILQKTLAVELPKRIHGPHKDQVIDLVRRSTGSISTLPPSEKLGAIESYQIAFHRIFIGLLVLSVLLLLACCTMKDLDLHAKDDQAVEEEQPSDREVS